MSAPGRVASIVVAVVAGILVAAPARAQLPPGVHPSQQAPAVVRSADHPMRPAEVHYAPPLDGPVVRVFDPGETPYAPGHRGVGLLARPGDRVHAAAAGTIRHAGPVAGVTWVSIVHADGIVTSYGPVEDVTVSAGDTVERGTPIGVVASGDDGRRGLHWGARAGTSYVDPRSLLTAAMPRPSLVGPGHWEGSSHAVTPYEDWERTAWLGTFVAASPTALRPGYTVPPTPNHLVMINGLATADDTLPLDPTDLGYERSDVTALSYAGRSDEHGPEHDVWRDQRPYGPSDTWSGVVDAAHRLEDQLRAQRVREPGRAVDIVGHSMGGLAAIYYLTHLHDPYDVTLPPIGNIVTIASPHGGADVADTARWLRADPLTQSVLQLALGLSLGHDTPQSQRTPLEMEALDQLATGSDLLDRHLDGWRSAVDAGPAGALAMGTRVLTIAGSRDVVATPSRSVLPPVGDDPSAVLTHAVLPGGHESVKTTEAVRQAAWEFMHAGELDDPVMTRSVRLTDGAGHAMRIAGRGAWELLRTPATGLP